MTQANVLAQLGSPGISTGFKNRIINGAMTIDQRNAGASVTPSATATNVYTVDRWAYFQSQASKFSVQQNAGSVTPPEGYNNYLGLTSQSAYSISSGDYFGVMQVIEGYNSADLGWGTANAKTVTLSFWVRSSLTGTFSGSFQTAAQTRSYVFTYSISSANTWEYKSITVPGDTSGTWVGASNSGAIRVNFSLGMGSSFAGSAGAWATANDMGDTGATSVVGTNGATFYITGVQLEVGTSATDFEYRPYGTELALCQRYFQRYVTVSTNARMAVGGWANSTEGQCAVFPPVTMRAKPTLTVPVMGQALQEGIAWRNITANSGSELSKDMFSVAFNVASSTASNGQVAYIGGSNFDYQFSAEL